MHTAVKRTWEMRRKSPGPVGKGRLNRREAQTGELEAESEKHREKLNMKDPGWREDQDPLASEIARKSLRPKAQKRKMKDRR